MELTIEIRARPGKFQELYQTLQALLPTIRKRERMPGLPDLPGHGGRGGLLSFGRLGSTGKPGTLYAVRQRQALLGADRPVERNGKGQDRPGFAVGGDRYPEENEKEDIAPPYEI